MRHKLSICINVEAAIAAVIAAVLVFTFLGDAVGPVISVGGLDFVCRGTLRGFVRCGILGKM